MNSARSRTHKSAARKIRPFAIRSTQHLSIVTTTNTGRSIRHFRQRLAFNYWWAFEIPRPRTTWIILRARTQHTHTHIIGHLIAHKFTIKILGRALRTITLAGANVLSRWFASYAFFVRNNTHAHKYIVYACALSPACLLTNTVLSFIWAPLCAPIEMSI